MNLKQTIKKYIFKKNSQPIIVGTLNESTRINWLEEALKKIPAGFKILDAGAGEQQFKEFCKHLQYVSQDFAQYKPENLNSGLQMVKWDYGHLDIISDIASIPREDESFDAVMCTEVFEHIVNPREAIKEFSRLLKSDGYLIITAPFCSLTHFAPYHFYSGFNRFFYEEELEKNGFKTIEIIPNGNYFEYLAQEVNRLPHMAKKYSNKKFNKTQTNGIIKLKALLQNLSDTDSNSSELLCFGYHVIARKK
ncbi:class I SAM-dependent methyltransferase [Flavobacterium xinjiangense]|uniref:Methyltransferase domain-containing protein n=1 Tax=Flavobacterium xinjiangense TaxID=178356 RepID=A0A1M7MVI0_9FLAO|nr:class I SAM-dependent methyltransferase [Flavobacterium xinjiangense]SHM95021.1 Methyltransferase domain-containing protein [Flavobacterium xinjiangense]